ncbi:MAG TPA: FAD-dependent oxidoreductase, partial [Thiothrix sp.]|nr:FAD-dependent oxidoreductase [Thiothrix sp.]
MNDSVIIIGGGVIGLLSAWQLSEAGYTVQLLEKAAIGQEASWAGGGIISPLFPWRYPKEVNDLAHYSQQHYQPLCETLADQTGIDPEWTRSGLIMPNHPVDPRFQQWADTYQQRYDHAKHASMIQQFAPAISPEFTQAIHLPDIAQLRNPRLLKALYAQLQQQSTVTIHTHTTVQGILHQQGKVTGVVSQQGHFYADKVISCQGAWSAKLDVFQSLTTRTSPSSVIHVKPVRGQMLLFKAPQKLLQQMILLDEGYLIPRRD